MEFRERFLCYSWYNFSFATHKAVYIYGLLLFHRIPEALKEYQNYNRYHFLNSRVNSYVLEGFLNAGLPADCLILFVTLLLDVRYNLDPNNVISVDGEKLINWTQDLTNAKPGFLVADEDQTFFDDATKQRLFCAAPSASSTETSTTDKPIELSFRKNIKDRWVPFNIPAYEYAVASACKLKNLQYATMLYEAIKANTPYKGRSVFFIILSVWKVYLLNSSILEKVIGKSSVTVASNRSSRSIESP